MSNAEMLREPAVETFRAATVDMKLEVVVIPSRTSIAPSASMATWVWRLDIDYTAGDDFRVIQFSPPGSGCSVIFGKNVTTAGQ